MYLVGPHGRGPTGEPLLVMSEVLLDLIDPLTVGLPDPPDLDTAEALVRLGALAWNVSRIDDDEERQEEIRQIRETATDLEELDLGPESRDLEPDAAWLAEATVALVDRSRTLWPDSRQEVLDVRVFFNEWGELRVRALWRFMDDEARGAHTG